MRKNNKRYLISFLAVIIIISGFSFIAVNERNNSIQSKVVEEENILLQNNDDIVEVNEPVIEEKEEIKQERVEKINILAVGDLLMHMGIINSQYDISSDKYDFSYNFQYVKDYLSQADLSIANLETTFSGAEVGYAGYPTFNCPDELADTMKDIGIDIVSNMSNHTYDCGNSGFLRTRSILEERGFDIIGTRKSENDKRYIIKDVKGVKLGVIAYSYATEDYDGTLGLNCIPINDESIPLMNIFSINEIDKYLAQMKEQIVEMKKDGADAIVFYMHWGEEYELEPNESQLKIAEFLANEGVDIIFGDHPHTIQPIDIIYSKDGSHKCDVIYSLGNFISCQRTETIDNPYTEDGIMVNVEIEKDFATGEIKVADPTYMPTWVRMVQTGGISRYQVLPYNDTEDLSDYEAQRISESAGRTESIAKQYNEAISVFN